MSYGVHMDAYVVYESDHGKARRAAEAIAEKAAAKGFNATVHSIEDADADDIAASETLVVGCTAQIDTPFGGDVRSHATRWLAALPELEGKPVAVYCTFSFFPHTFADATARTAEVLHLLTRGIESRGGAVVTVRSIQNRKLDAGAAALVSELIEQAAA